MSLTTEQIWERLGRELLRFFQRRTRDAATADDLLQETFVRVHARLTDLRAEEGVLGWVWRVARNVLADHGRARGAPSADGDSETTEEERGNLNAEVGRWLLEGLPDLPGDYREALELAEVQGLKQQAIADRLGLSLSGAKSRVQRGRGLLRETLLACCHLEFDRRGNVVDYRRRGTCRGCCDDA